MDILLEAQKLQKSRLLRSEKEIRDFDEAINNVLMLKSINHIKCLCLGFDDKTDRDEVMFGLVHAIESYDKIFGVEKTLAMFAEAVPDMYPHATRWAKTLHKRILNDDQSRKVYAKVVSKIDPKTKNRIIDLMEDIKNSNPVRFEATATEFLGELKI